MNTNTKTTATTSNQKTATQNAKASLGDIVFNLIFTIVFTIVGIAIVVLGIRADIMEHSTLTTSDEQTVMQIIETPEEPEEDVLSAYITSEVR